jgi:hypothetical protein
MTRGQRSRKIQDSIRRLLLGSWDPIGIADVPEAQDEYGTYIGGVYGLLASGASPETVAQHLAGIQRDSMGLSVELEALMPVAKRLCALDVSQRGPGESA